MKQERVFMKKKIQVVIFSAPSGEVLLLKTNKKRGGIWQNVTGGACSDEMVIEAASRELEEETGIQSSSLKDLNVSFEFTDRHGHLVVEHCFLCFLDHTPKITLSSEHEEYRWWPLDKIQISHYTHASNFNVFRMAIKQAE